MLKLACQLPRNDIRNAKKSHVCGHRKMPKSRRSAVVEKCQKVTNPQSRKNTKKSQVCSYEEIQKMLRSAGMQKCLILACPLLQNDNKNAKNSQVRVQAKMPKNRRSVVTEKCQSQRSTFTEKCQKVAGPRSRKNTKNT